MSVAFGHDDPFISCEPNLRSSYRIWLFYLSSIMHFTIESGRIKTHPSLENGSDVRDTLSQVEVSSPPQRLSSLFFLIACIKQYISTVSYDTYTFEEDKLLSRRVAYYAKILKHYKNFELNHLCYEH